MNNKIIIANWKMNPATQKEAKQLFNSVEKVIGNIKNVEVVICPPFVYFLDIACPGGSIRLGGQNCFWKQKGAFTGEISARMLKNLGCEYVILGHSERRQHLRETDEMIAKKLRGAFDAGLVPIFCIGETKKQRQQGKTQEILTTQLSILDNLITQSLDHLILAYEPVWAIGTGNACNPDDAKTVLSFLKEKINEVIPRQIPILYGGSVDSDNAKNYIEVGFEGLLVGNASLNPEEFVKIVQTLNKI